MSAGSEPENKICQPSGSRLFYFSVSSGKREAQSENPTTGRVPVCHYFDH